MSRTIHYGRDRWLSACGKKYYPGTLIKSDVTCNACKRTYTYSTDAWRKIKEAKDADQVRDDSDMR